MIFVRWVIFLIIALITSDILGQYKEAIADFDKATVYYNRGLVKYE